MMTLERGETVNVLRMSFEHGPQSCRVEVGLVSYTMVITNRCCHQGKRVGSEPAHWPRKTSPIYQCTHRPHIQRLQRMHCGGSHRLLSGTSRASRPRHLAKIFAILCRWHKFLLSVDVLHLLHSSSRRTLLSYFLTTYQVPKN